MIPISEIDYIKDRFAVDIDKFTVDVMGFDASRVPREIVSLQGKVNSREFLGIPPRHAMVFGLRWRREMPRVEAELIVSSDGFEFAVIAGHIDGEVKVERCLLYEQVDFNQIFEAARCPLPWKP